MLNEYYQNIGFKGFIKRYGVLNALRRGVFMACPVHIVKNYETRKLLWQEKAARRVRPYLKYKDNPARGLVFPKENVGEPVWVYWSSGIENAPDLVKRCFLSIQRYHGKDVVLLSDKNLGEYIRLPKYIEEKKSLGQIPTAVYADLMRFALLSHYGGTWVDATVYLTGGIPSGILKSDFFAFRNSLLLIDNPSLYPVWFIHAKKGNKTMAEICNVAFAYWKNNKHLHEYLMSNLIITCVLKEDAEAEKRIPYMNSDYSEFLIKVLGDDYSKEKLDWIKSLTHIHKLTYKLDPKIDRTNSFYRHIMTESE